MKIRINDRPDIQEIEVIINCVADDPLVNKIISALNTVDAKLLCRRQGETFQLGLADILYIESVDRKTFLGRCVSDLFSKGGVICGCSQN